MEVVTRNRSRDIRFFKRLNIEVATFRRGHDINTESGIVPRVGIRYNMQGIKVATSFRGRNQKMNLLWEEWMSA